MCKLRTVSSQYRDAIFAMQIFRHVEIINETTFHYLRYSTAKRAVSSRSVRDCALAYPKLSEITGGRARSREMRIKFRWLPRNHDE